MLTEIKKLDSGQFFAHHLKMERLSGEMKGAMTLIDFEKVKVDIELNDRLFSPQQLGRR